MKYLFSNQVQLRDTGVRRDAEVVDLRVNRSRKANFAAIFKAIDA